MSEEEWDEGYVCDWPHGFHVHLRRFRIQEMREVWDTERVIAIPVRCQMRHLLAADKTEAVFKQIEITKRAWNARFKPARRVGLFPDVLTWDLTEAWLTKMNEDVSRWDI